MTPVDKRTAILMGEVEECVKAGKKAFLARNDTARRIARYLDTQKRYIGLNLTVFVLTASIGVLGGPIAAAVALGGSILGWGLSTAWDRFQLSRHRGKYQTKRLGLEKALATSGMANSANSHDVVTKKEKMKLANGQEELVGGHLNTEYAGLVNDVRQVLQRQGLTDLFNAFANMESDFLNIHKFIPDTSFSTAWEQGGTFGPRRSFKGMGSVNLRSCDQAVELWESIKRVEQRYAAVAETHAMFDEFIMYAALSVSRYDADERHLIRNTWSYLDRDRNPAKLLDMMNKVVNSEGIRKHFGRRLGRELDYTAWIYALIPDWLKDSWSPGYAMTVRLEVLRRTNEAEFNKALQSIVKAVLAGQRASSVRIANPVERGSKVGKAAGFTGEVIKDYVTSTIALPGEFSLEEVGGAIKDNAINIGGQFLSTYLQSLTSAQWQIAYAGATPDTLASLSNASDAQQTAMGTFNNFNAAGGFAQLGMAIATSVARVALEAANAYWEERKLQTGETFGITTGFRQQEISERIGTLRNVAKREIEAYVDLIEDWGKANDALRAPTTDTNLASGFIRFLKSSAEYYRNRTGQLFEEAVFTANQMEEILRSTVDRAEGAIHDQVGRADHSACASGKFCYDSLAGRLLKWFNARRAYFSPSFLATLPTAVSRFEEVPVRSLSGDQYWDLVSKIVAGTGASPDVQDMLLYGNFGD
jgi:hypothetical protein